MNRTQRLRRHDGVGGVEVKHRHDEGHQHDKNAEPALEFVGRAFLGFNEFFGLVQGGFADSGFGLVGQ